MIFYKICKVRTDLGYRGIYRPGPHITDFKQQNETIVDLWSEYTNNEIQEKTTYKQVTSVIKLLKRPTDFEIIKIVEEPTQQMEHESEFLGYDITDISRDHSFFYWDWEKGPSWDGSTPNIILMRLIFDAFESKLNSNRLLPDIVTAEQFQKSITALSTLSPGTFESPEAEVFFIFGIFQC